MLNRVETFPAVRSFEPAAPAELKRNAKPVVLFALKEEARPFLRCAKGRTDIDVHTSGMGRKNAEAAMSRILEAGRPDRLITAGVAAALRPDFAIGDIVFATADASFAKQLLALGAKPATFALSERVAVTADEKRRLREQTGADVVENESVFVQAICREKGIGCTIIRAVSDGANDDLPFDFNTLQGPDGNVDYRKVLVALAHEPWKLFALLKLWHHTRTATKKLSAFLLQALPQR